IASNTRRDCIRGTPPIRHYSLDQAFAMSGWGWAGTAAAMRPACSFLDGALAEGREVPAHRLQRRFGVRYEAPVDLDLGDDLVHPPLRAEERLRWISPFLWSWRTWKVMLDAATIMRSLISLWERGPSLRTLRMLNVIGVRPNGLRILVPAASMVAAAAMIS